MHVRWTRQHVARGSQLTFRASTLVVVSTLTGERCAVLGEEVEPVREEVGEGRGIWTADGAAMASWNTSHCSSFSSESLPGGQSGLNFLWMVC